jgi:DNA primase large subunit
MAKYPFIPQAVEYVQNLELKITELDNQEYACILNRAEKRIEEAIVYAQIGQQDQNQEIEILSFPIAVMLVSATNDSFLKRRYALAEAKRAYNELKLESTEKIFTITDIFRWKIQPTEQTMTNYPVHFTDYLRNTAGFHEDKWKLVNRMMQKGEVRLTKNEIARILAEEVRRHIEKKLEAKLDIELPQTIVGCVEKLEQMFIIRKGKIRLEEMPKEVVVDAFPPCIRQLYNDSKAGRHLSHIGRFALTSFLIQIGMNSEDVVNLFRSSSDFNEKMSRYQVEHIAGGRGSGTKYIPPRCDTLRTHGVCPGMDEICRRTRHPLSHYRRKLRSVKEETSAVTRA